MTPEIEGNTAMTDPTPAERSPSEKDTSPSLYRATASAAHHLQRELLSGDAYAVSRARATLSLLRRAAAQTPGDDHRAWWEIAEHILGDLPDADRGHGQTASHAEWAAFVALTMFSLHQQSNTQPMHVAGVSLGRAVGALRRQTGSESIKPRLDAVMVATTEAGLRYHVRSLVSLLSSHGIALDYGRLAEDLRWMRDPRHRREAVIRWGRDYASGLRAAASESDAVS